eukprot:SAG31_NODE_771_length_12216_cov_5.603862_5_plen_110_part_00
MEGVVGLAMGLDMTAAKESADGVEFTLDFLPRWLPPANDDDEAGEQSRHPFQTVQPRLCISLVKHKYVLRQVGVESINTSVVSWVLSAIVPLMVGWPGRFVWPNRGNCR